MASFFLASESSRSSRLRSSSSAATRAGTSSIGTRNSAAVGFGKAREIIGVGARRPGGQRLDAAHAGGNAAFADHRNEADVAGAATCVPPHSSTDQPSVLPPPSPMATTRTSSPYFSPNSARAPEAIASSRLISRVVTGAFCSTMSLAMSSTRSISVGAHRLRMREIEAQPVGRDQRALLRDVIAEHLAQRLVQQMRRRMVCADRAAPRVIDLETSAAPTLERALLDRAEMHEQVAGAASACR